MEYVSLLNDILMEILFESADQTIKQTRQTVTGKQISGDRTEEDYKHGVRVLYKPGTVDATSIQALPWQTSTASLNQLHSIQQAQIEQEKALKQQERELERKQKEEQEFNQRMNEEMKRQMELQQKSQRPNETVKSEIETVSTTQSVEFEDPILRVSGVEYPLSSITSAEVTAMTDEEFAIYESYVNAEQLDDE